MRERSSLETLTLQVAMPIADTASRSDRSLDSAVAASTRVGRLLKQAMTYFETDRGACWRCLSDASTLLGAVVEVSAAGSASTENLRPGGLAHWQARRALDYIEANLASKMEAGDLANVVALSRSHFSRAFKQSVGLPPMEYVAMRRAERAKTMIRSTKERLAEVALACGFADQAHLCRRFRHLFGMSPGRWRRAFP